MKEQFVTYKIAKKLKSLGFDESCLSTYSTANNDSEEDFAQTNDEGIKYHYVREWLDEYRY